MMKAIHSRTGGTTCTGCHLSATSALPSPYHYHTISSTAVQLSPIAENSPLLPPVGVWAVSQSECGFDLQKIQIDPDRYPFVEGRSSFSWEYGMGYFSVVAPGTRTLARGIFSTPSYPEKAGSPYVLEPKIRLGIIGRILYGRRTSFFLDLSKSFFYFAKLFSKQIPLFQEFAELLVDQCHHGLVENDSGLVRGLLEVEGALVGSSRTCSQFEKDRVTLLLRPEPRNPLDMMQNGSCSILEITHSERFLKDYVVRLDRISPSGINTQPLVNLRRCVLPGSLVLEKGPLNALTPTPDMDRTVSRRSEPAHVPL
ncbi:hypothetical protein OSB04_028317 [Centaurea solstitialis]|uniref:Uncharacterized protein n=1 Tax=Centaurea solstitialis TaxID=347529 RepID=A0AA38SSE8_9ASTR|nr:hypothetical protein OSB04_028317 [Centaurea solstitialis]